MKKALESAGLIVGISRTQDENSRGIKGEMSPLGYHFGWLKGCKCPAVLCECAFIDNKADLNVIATPEKQKAFGAAYVLGVLEYFLKNIPKQ